MDPIADKFFWVNTYNYAENEPVANIDLHGLQKVRYDINAVNNKTFHSAHAINEQTTGGLKFLKTLKSQSKVDVVYAIKFQGPADGVTSGPFKSFEEFTKKRSENYGLYYSTVNNWQDYESYFEEGKELMVISVDCGGEIVLIVVLGKLHKLLIMRRFHMG